MVLRRDEKPMLPMPRRFFLRPRKLNASAKENGTAANRNPVIAIRPDREAVLPGAV